jgi:hypothetical protein
MKNRRSITRREGRTSRRASASAVALMAIAFGAIVTGCIKNYDPRDDGSHIDSDRSDALAISIEYDPA